MRIGTEIVNPCIAKRYASQENGIKVNHVIKVYVTLWKEAPPCM